MTTFIPYGVLVSHAILIVFFASILLRNSLARWLGRHAVILSFIVVLGAVLGSLYYSEIVGFEPCLLCWWQRVFIFPMLVIFLIAWWKKLSNAFAYALPFAIIALVVAGYHSYFELGGTSLLPCTAEGGACSRVYVKAFGYITIPVMSLTVSLFVLLFAWANRLVNRAPKT